MSTSDLSSSGVPLIIGETSFAAPLVVASHFCQTESAISTDTQYGLMPIRQRCIVKFSLQDTDNDLIFKINHF